MVVWLVLLRGVSFAFAMTVKCGRWSDIKVVLLPEGHLCSKLLMNMLSVRVVVVLETLVGKFIKIWNIYEKVRLVYM